MCLNGTAVHLASLVMEMESEIKRFERDPSTQERLCACRREILDCFTKVLQLLAMRLTSRMLRFDEDLESKDRRASISDLHSWFYEKTYMSLYKSKRVSGKMVVLFELLQRVFDDGFFNCINEAWRRVSREDQTDEERMASLRCMYRKLSEWLEVVFFNISSFKIDCGNLSEEIVKDGALVMPKCNMNRAAECVRCADCVKGFECPKSACQHHVPPDCREEIHLHVINEQLDKKGWIKNFLNTFAMYHKDPKNIDVIIDFSITDEGTEVRSSEIEAILTTVRHFFRSVEIHGRDSIKITED